MSQIVMRRLRGARLGAATTSLPSHSIQVPATRQQAMVSALNIRASTSAPDPADVSEPELPPSTPPYDEVEPPAETESNFSKYAAPVALAAVVLGAFWWLR